MIHELIDTYYHQPILNKVKDENQCSIYMAEIKTLLSNQYQYIVAIVEQDLFFIGENRRLKDLHWVSFQVRTFPHKQPNVHAKCSPHLNKDKTLNKMEIQQTFKNEEMTFYQCKEIPLKVILINDKKNFYDYSSKGTIQSALETYQTILEFV